MSVAGDQWTSQKLQHLHVNVFFSFSLLCQRLTRLPSSPPYLLPLIIFELSKQRVSHFVFDNSMAFRDTHRQRYTGPHLYTHIYQKNTQHTENVVM